MDGNSLALAMRIIAAACVGIESPLDVKKLLALQQQDGSWTDGWYYKFPRTALCVKNDGFATALAIQAIQVAERLKSDNSHWEVACGFQTGIPSKLGFSKNSEDDDEISDTSTESGEWGIGMHRDHDTDTSGDELERNGSRIQVRRPKLTMMKDTAKNDDVISDTLASPSDSLGALTEDRMPVQGAEAYHVHDHNSDVHDIEMSLGE